jgi:hypothetical protein
MPIGLFIIPPPFAMSNLYTEEIILSIVENGNEKAGVLRDPLRLSVPA